MWRYICISVDRQLIYEGRIRKFVFGEIGYLGVSFNFFSCFLVIQVENLSYNYYEC